MLNYSRPKEYPTEALLIRSLTDQDYQHKQKRFIKPWCKDTSDIAPGKENGKLNAGAKDYKNLSRGSPIGITRLAE